MAVDVETSLFPGQHTPLSPVRSHPIAPSSISSPSAISSASVMTSLDTTTTSSQVDLGLMPSQTSSLLSLHGSGLAGRAPGQLSAGAHAVAGPLIVEEVQSLHALCKSLCVCVCVCVFSVCMELYIHCVCMHSALEIIQEVKK